MTFQELGLNAPILNALLEQGYEKPSPIQEKAIPPALAGRDVLGCAQTGTGKTCAFAVPILQRLSAAPTPGRPIRALILTPTRELAIQIGESFAAYGKHLKLRCAVIFGGVGQNPQVEALKAGVDVLVATPGRLMDLYQQGFVHLDRLGIFVLDEADRMLDMGFIHDVRKILKWLPEKKQTMLFSATMPAEIADLVNSLLKEPVKVAVDPVSSPVEAIRQSVYLVDRGNKTKLLAHLIGTLGVKNALVFTRTKHGANKVAKDLGKLGISAAAIHGNKSQTARQQALSEFKADKLQCLVATDIAARGLDIEELSHVFNYNLPDVPETYVHRIGRTGRAGRGGDAVAFCDFSEKPLLKDIEKLIGRKVPVVEDHPYPMQVFEAPKRDKNGRIVNEEDAEARAAAREHHRAVREAERAAAAHKGREDAGPARREPAPAAPKPKKKAVPEKKPKDEAPAFDYLPQRPKLTRPGSFLDTGDAMPRTEFHRPNPLDSDVIMDATARLLAPRRPLKLEPEMTSGQGSSRRKKKKSPAKREQEKREGAARREREKREEAGRTAPAAQQQPKNKKEAKPAGQERNAPSPNASKKRRGRPDRVRRGAPLEPQRPHAKDTTEQPSLMKPYYLDIGR